MQCREGRGLRGSAPPRSQRAPRGEEAAAARRGHFVSAAAAQAQDGGGGRVSGRRPPRPRESPPLFPSLLSQAPRGSLLLFLERAESRAAAQSRAGGAPARGPRLELSAGTVLGCAALPPPAPFPCSGAAAEPSLSRRAGREGPRAAPRHGEQQRLQGRVHCRRQIQAGAEDRLGLLRGHLFGDQHHQRGGKGRSHSPLSSPGGAEHQPSSLRAPPAPGCALRVPGVGSSFPSGVFLSLSFPSTRGFILPLSPEGLHPPPPHRGFSSLPLPQQSPAVVGSPTQHLGEEKRGENHCGKTNLNIFVFCEWPKSSSLARHSSPQLGNTLYLVSSTLIETKKIPLFFQLFLWFFFFFLPPPDGSEL